MNNPILGLYSMHLPISMLKFKKHKSKRDYMWKTGNIDFQGKLMKKFKKRKIYNK